MLKVGAALRSSGCGTVGPTVVVFVMADGCGKFRIVPQALFERLLEKVAEGLRPGKLLQEQGWDQKNGSHDADYIAGRAFATPNLSFGNIFVILSQSKETAMKLSVVSFGIL